MIKIKEAVIVEGKYDKIKLSSIINAVIIPTNGFNIFKNKETVELVKFYAEHTGIIIMTDSDAAGFKIRSYIKSVVKNGRIINVYIPDVFGKEKRKTKPSAEGKLGVEGISKDLIIEAFEKAGVAASANSAKGNITKADLFEYGLTGGNNSSVYRKVILKALGLPGMLSANGMLEVINTMMNKEEFEKIIDSVVKGD